MRRPGSGDGVTYIQLEFVKQPIEEGPPPRRPRRRRSREDSEEGEGLGDPRAKSIPICVWELLKTGPCSVVEGAVAVGCARTGIHHAMSALRHRGHKIVRRAGRYHLENDLPLKVAVQPNGKLRLARLEENAGVEVMELP